MPDPQPEAGTPALEAALNWTGSAFAYLVGDSKRVLAYALGGAGLATVAALLIPNQYTSSATFIAQESSSSSLPAGLQGLAATVGLDKGNDYSPKFYADLLTSRPVLSSAIQHEYRVSQSDTSRRSNYLQIEGFDGDRPAAALDAALKQIAKRVSASADVRTNIITLSVRARYPELSRDMADHLLRTLDSLNVGFRREQSRELREFYEDRVIQARRELDSAEVSVRDFLQKNRVTQDPALQFELQRRQRDADLKRDVYATVVQQYEQARMQEARNVPTLTVLSEPFVPIKKSFPPRRLIVLLGAALGLGLLIGRITIGEAMTRFREQEPEKWDVLEEQIRKVRHLVSRQG